MKCPSCNGHGSRSGYLCEYCNGSGSVPVIPLPLILLGLYILFFIMAIARFYTVPPL